MQAVPSSHAGLERTGEVAYRSLYPCWLQVVAVPGPSYALSRVPCVMDYDSIAHSSAAFLLVYSRFRVLPVKRCGQGCLFNPQMRFNRFVFLNRPVLSLETRLGVTASPQAPFPADYVTRPVSDLSPPLRLTSSRNRRRACSLMQHQFLEQCIPVMLKQLRPHQGGLRCLGVP